MWRANNEQEKFVHTQCMRLIQRKKVLICNATIHYLSFLLSSPQYLIISRKGETSSNHVENKSLHVSLGTKYVLSNGFCHGRPLCN